MSARTKKVKVNKKRRMDPMKDETFLEFLKQITPKLEIKSVPLVKTETGFQVHPEWWDLKRINWKEAAVAQGKLLREARVETFRTHAPSRPNWKSLTMCGIQPEVLPSVLETVTNRMLGVNVKPIVVNDFSQLAALDEVSLLVPPPIPAATIPTDIVVDVPVEDPQEIRPKSPILLEEEDLFGGLDLFSVISWDDQMESILDELLVDSSAEPPPVDTALVEDDEVMRMNFELAEEYLETTMGVEMNVEGDEDYPGNATPASSIDSGILSDEPSPEEMILASVARKDHCHGDEGFRCSRGRRVRLRRHQD